MRTLDRGGADAEKDVVCLPNRDDVLRGVERGAEDFGVKNAAEDELVDAADTADVEAAEEVAAEA